VTWSEPKLDAALIEPVCQASLRRYSFGENGEKSRLLFSNPASDHERVDLTVRLSYDEGKTWPESKLLQAGPAAYSCLARLPDGGVLCFYENGEKSSIDKLTLARFTIDWLTGGRDK
jgi:sialidase-1